MAKSFSYDAKGNLTSDGTNSYAYTTANQLTGGPNIGLGYDAVGHLISSYNYSQSAQTQYLYDGDELIAEYNSSGAVTARYVHGPGADNPVVWYNSSWTSDRRWLVANEQGSIIAVANASGQLLAANTYDEYGLPGASNLGRFQYAGQAWIPELGMYNDKARFYSPPLGRFLQTDPSGYADGLNWYAYAHNDAVNGTDPTGLADQAPIGVRPQPPNGNGNGAGGDSGSGGDFGLGDATDSDFTYTACTDSRLCSDDGSGIPLSVFGLGALSSSRGGGYNIIHYGTTYVPGGTYNVLGSGPTNVLSGDYDLSVASIYPGEVDEAAGAAISGALDRGGGGFGAASPNNKTPASPKPPTKKCSASAGALAGGVTMWGIEGVQIGSKGGRIGALIGEFINPAGGGVPGAVVGVIAGVVVGTAVYGYDQLSGGQITGSIPGVHCP